MRFRFFYLSIVLLMSDVYFCLGVQQGIVIKLQKRLTAKKTTFKNHSLQLKRLLILTMLTRRK